MQRFLACVSVVVLLSTPSAGAAVPEWREYRAFDDIRWDHLEALGPDDIWLFGERVPALGDGRPAVRHWNGTALETVPLPKEVRGGIGHADFASPDEGWAVGCWSSGGSADHCAVLRWDGGSWTLVRSVRTEGWGEVKALGGGAVLVTGLYAGAPGPDSGAEEEWFFDGSTWTERTPASSLRSFSGRHAVSFTEEEESLVRWDGGAWRPVPVTGLPAPAPGHPLGFTLVEEGPGEEVWVTVERPFTDGEAATTHLMRWDGLRWTRERVPLPSTDAAVHAIAADGEGGLWLAGDTQGHVHTSPPTIGDPLLYHRLPSGVWTTAATGTFLHNLVRLPGTTVHWALGDSEYDSSSLYVRGRDN